MQSEILNNSSSAMAFFPLFLVKTESSTDSKFFNEGLYIMTCQSNTTDVGVFVGIKVGKDRVGQPHLTLEYSRPRSHPFPHRQYLGNIQLALPNELFEWFKSRRQYVNLIGTASNSLEESATVNTWFMDVAHDLKNLKS